ncbi:hypothetical protein GJ496_009225 [Pomphorhynchus laevis]|nr:hypothetical protein GJ496_009225 [Pomphorhynchus laevis]
MTIVLTMIGRVSDGLILVASIESDDASVNITTAQDQAKRIILSLSGNPPLRASIESGPFVFHYQIDQRICALVLVDKNYSKKMAFAFLEELSSEFNAQYSRRLHLVDRPYAFIEFDNFIQKAQKKYIDLRSPVNLNKVTGELNEVQRILVANIEDVLGRGEALTALKTKANALSSISSKYREDTKELNRRATMFKVGLGISIIVILAIFLRIWLF